MNMLFIEMKIKICEIGKDSALSVKLYGLLSALSCDLGSSSPPPFPYASLRGQHLAHNILRVENASREPCLLT